MKPPTESILAVSQPPRRDMSTGLSIRHVHPETLGWDLDPILQVDWFRMSQPFFPPHPHAGFSAVTYMLPESAGGFINRDSLGDRSLIRPGALHWTEAGRGVVHEEVPEHPGTACDGLQIFVNLPARQRQAEPRIYHVEPADVPTVRVQSGTVRVLCGDFNGTTAAIRPRTNAVLWDVSIPSGSQLTLPVDPSGSLSGLLCSGSLLHREGTAPAGTALRFAVGEALNLSAGEDDVRLVILGGVALREPIVSGGPFVMSTPAELADAGQRYRRGEMGQLNPSFQR